MANFPRKKFKTGDDPSEFLDHKILNYIMDRVSREITVGPGLELSDAPFGWVIGLADNILQFRVVELTTELEAYNTATAAIIRKTEAEGVTRDDTLSLTVDDVFGNTEVIGSRGIALEMQFSDTLRWLYCPCGRAEESSSSSGADDNKARFIDFILDGALTTEQENTEATVDDFWDGDEPEGLISVWNKAINVATGGYMFEGDIGDRGMAVWDEKRSQYRIWQMECP